MAKMLDLIRKIVGQAERGANYTHAKKTKQRRLNYSGSAVSGNLCADIAGFSRASIPIN